MIKGIIDKENNHLSFKKITFELSNIIEWGNISGYYVGKDYALKESNDTEKLLYQNKDFSIKYNIKSSMLPSSKYDLLRENITLEQRSNIEITFEEEKNIVEFDYIFKKIKRLIELSTLKIIFLTKMTGQSEKYKKLLGDKEIELPISIISNDFTEIEFNNNSAINHGWIHLQELINNNSFENYFKSYDILEPIVELYIEIIESKNMSPVRKFLNITQALETYHARFKADTLTEFTQRVDEVILTKSSPNSREEDRQFLLETSKKSVSLQSRLADLLLADFEIHFSTGNIKRSSFPRIIAKTRNYYTHYNEELKNKEIILTKEELSIYNQVLLYILEYYLLRELGFSNIALIINKLNNRWGDISTSFDLQNASQKKFRNICNKSFDGNDDKD